MADDDERAAEPRQPVLEPFDRGDVEVVGRLVEQQHVGVHRQRARDRRAPPLAARSRSPPRAIRSMPSWSAIASTSCCAGASSPASAKSSNVAKPGDLRILFEQHDLACPARSCAGPRPNRSARRSASSASSCPRRCARSAPAGRARRCTGRARGTASPIPGRARGLHTRESGAAMRAHLGSRPRRLAASLSRPHSQAVQAACPMRRRDEHDVPRVFRSGPALAAPVGGDGAASSRLPSRATRTRRSPRAARAARCRCAKSSAAWCPRCRARNISASTSIRPRRFTR